ncbi:hypothetical protein GW17_00019368 [Ensete ventricosum]|nr:hypothetical protein GW17_00019368 [Ensete ventricosum]
MEATTSNSIELLLPSRASYTRNLSRADNKLRSFRSCLRWMCVNQSNAKYVMVSWSLFLLDVFISIASHFILSYAHIHCCAYDVVV